jgi:hypothetical protein
LTSSSHGADNLWVFCRTPTLYEDNPPKMREIQRGRDYKQNKSNGY